MTDTAREKPVEQATAEDRPEDPAPVYQYFTDGAHLYRFVGWISRSIDEKLAELEDCRSLNIVLIPASELDEGRLQGVR